VRHEVDHSPPSTAEVKNDWHYTSALPICLYGMNRDKFLSFMIHCHVNRSPPLNHTNALHALTPYFFKIHCSIILPSGLFFTLAFPTKNFYAVQPTHLIFIESITLVYIYSIKLQHTKLVIMQLFHLPIIYPLLSIFSLAPITFGVDRGDNKIL
jgi:hypothetical protein